MLDLLNLSLVSTDLLQIQILPVTCHIPNKDKGDGFDNRPNYLITESVQEQGRPLRKTAVVPRAGLPSPDRASLVETSPFDTGVHLIINQEAWWTNQQQISLDRTRFIPAVPNREVIIPTFSQRYFKVRLSETGDLEAAIWSESTYSKIDSCPDTVETIPAGSSHRWRFRSYEPDAVIPLANETPTVITFGQKLVKMAWLITHRRINTQEETYLVVLKEASFTDSQGTL